MALTAAVVIYPALYAVFAKLGRANTHQKTLPVGLEATTGQYELRDGELMAGSSLIALPLLILLVFLNRYFIGGRRYQALMERATRSRLRDRR